MRCGFSLFSNESKNCSKESMKKKSFHIQTCAKPMFKGIEANHRLERTFSGFIFWLEIDPSV